MSERERITTILSAHGVGPVPAEFHSWRCSHPDRYPDYCTCVSDLVDDLLGVVSESSGHQDTDLREAAAHLSDEHRRLIDLYVLEQGPLIVERTPDGARFVARQDVRLRLKTADEIRNAETERIVGIIKAYYAVAPKAATPLLDRINETETPA